MTPLDPTQHAEPSGGASLSTSTDTASSEAQPSTRPASEVRTPRFRAATVLAVALVAIIAGSALFTAGFVLGNRTATEPGTPPAEADAFQAFWDAYSAVRNHYAG